jgi:anti-sigma factor RsiW
MSDLHLDDEQLSAVLDGEVDAPAHMDDCPACSGRLAQLTAARDAVAAAVVPPLAGSVLDAVIAAAVASGSSSSPSPSSSTVVSIERRRRLRTPPPAWLLGAAAALLLLVGVAGVLGSTGDHDDSAANMALTSGADREKATESDAGAVAGAATDAATGAGAGGSSAADESASTFQFADPSVVSFDLADQSDPAELGVLLRDRVGLNTTAAAASGAPAAPAPRAAAPTTTAPADVAMCRAAAERAGGDDLGPLLATGTVRWNGQLAEVLVYALREQTNDVTRLAMVLQRPGCALLAERRF